MRSRALQKLTVLVRAFRLLARRAPVLVHPTPLSLVRYHAGELPPERQHEIQEHFLFCPLCAELLLDIKAFTDPFQAAAAPDGFLAEAWQALRSRLDRAGRSPGSTARRPNGAPPPMRIH
jgi:hypothetical protein